MSPSSRPRPPTTSGRSGLPYRATPTYRRSSNGSSRRPRARRRARRRTCHRETYSRGNSSASCASGGRRGAATKKRPPGGGEKKSGPGGGGGRPGGGGRRGCYYCRRDMRSADSPELRPLQGPDGGSGSSDEALNPLLHRGGQLGHAVGKRVTTLLEIAQRLLDLTAALAQFALDANASFAHLALEAVAGGDAATLEAAQLVLCLRARGVGRERVAHGRDYAFASNQRGADGYQDRALGVVAERSRAFTRGGLRLADGRLALVGGTCTGGACARRFGLCGAARARAGAASRGGFRRGWFAGGFRRWLSGG